LLLQSDNIFVIQ